MRKSQAVKSIVLASILYIVFMMYLGANYDRYLNFLMVKENITMISFGIIAFLSLIITLFTFKLKKVKESRDYYYELKEKHEQNNWDKDKQILDLRQLVKELKKPKRKK